MFAVLAAHANQVVSREQLVDAVWGTDAPATAMSGVYTYVARLRSSIEPARPSRAPSSLLVSERSGYMLLLPPDQVDQQQFETHLNKARQLHGINAVHSAIGQLDAGLALWQGAAYGGTVGPFVEAERVRLAELRLIAAEYRAEMFLELGRNSEIMGELFGLARRYPLRERLRYLLMRCYIRLGRQTDAITEYQSLRAALADELGIEPGEELRRLHERLLRRDPGRENPGQRGQGPDESLTSGWAVVPAQLPRDVPGFTGRAAELQRVHDLVSAAESRGESAVVLLSGGPGTGKTALAVHAAHSLSRRFPHGQLYLNLHGFGNSGRPTPPTEALGHVLAALGVPSPSTTDLERQCALYRTLVAGRRLLVLLDNAVSAEQIRPLLPGEASCVVIVTSRNRLSGLTARDGANRVSLDVMSEEDSIRLLGQATGVTFQAPELVAARKLVAACGRLPLALRIVAARIGTAASLERTVRQFAERVDLDQFSVPDDEQTSLKSVFDWSYRALSHNAAEMFHAIGQHNRPDVALYTAAALVHTDLCHTRRMMDTLVEASLVQEPSQDHFRLNPLALAYARQLMAGRDPGSSRRPAAVGAGQSAGASLAG